MSGKETRADEEWAFNSAKGITKCTSSNHPGHVIGNVLIRLKAEESLQKLVERYQSSEQQSKVTKPFQSLVQFQDTLVPAYTLNK